MPELTKAHVDEIIEKLDSLPDDAEPNWGKLDKAGLIEHMLWAVNASMNPDAPVKFVGNFVTTKVVGPLILNQLIPFPKNVKLPAKDGAPPVVTRTEGDIADLKAAYESFLSAREGGSLKTPPHPVFGDIGPKGWAKMHVAHANHHFKQFGLPSVA